MAQPKFDGVVEAVHYSPDGKRIEWVRVYERRGPTFSDRVIMDRQTFIDHLKAGKRFYAGKRIPLMASTFDLGQPVRVENARGGEVLVIGDGSAENDQLQGVPVL